MPEKTLFKDFNPNPQILDGKTCRHCKHRERWGCGNSIIQYCGILSSTRTFNKKLKIKCTRPACKHWEDGK